MTDLVTLPARAGTASRMSRRERLEIVPPVSAPGDYIVLRAEIDCIVALSACPHDIFPVTGADATPRDVAYAVTRA